MSPPAPQTDDASSTAGDQPDTVLSLGLLNVSKLQHLDDELRKVIEKITPAQLTKLLAVVGKQDHFFFLSLLCVSKNVYHEAHHIFASVNKVELSIAANWLSYNEVFTNGVANFTRLKITIPTRWSISLPGSGTIAKYHTASKLEAVMSMLQAADANSSVNIRVHIFFEVFLSRAQLNFFGHPSIGLLAPGQTFTARAHFPTGQQWEMRAQAAFIQAQLADMVSEMRRRVILPANVILTTNADTPISGVEVVRENSLRVRYRISAERQQGVVVLDEGHALHYPEPACKSCDFTQTAL